ncbi:RluA family pseudouridine synthase [Metabacillus fastidiosus]|uniref:RluA family pseudouridine synthase n=1 Tax=Metabacillus fastidiosus TaxID=1458 RepID=UPI002DBC9F87|nr:RluA family pseudouridine synthase [Metabacillus fastidiosus]MEC2077093.1 RluA family pseudouridine synthase [Metabacillus fastidiosus]
MKSFRLQWTMTKVEEGKLIREFLQEKRISKRALTDIKFSGGAIKVNGEDANVRHLLKDGEILTVIFPEEKRSDGLKRQKLEFQIVHEDDHCLVINKPPFLPSIPSREHQTGTLANGLADYYEENDIPSTVHIVNRLDKDTSGIMLVAKHRFAHSLFSAEQKEKRIERTYTAIVHGVIENDTGIINEPIGRKADSIIEREVRSDGQTAVTHYRVLQRFDDKTLLSLKLETGRTHQIRVHLSSIGHPLCGDTLYGGMRTEINRQALHSEHICFWHPFLEKEVSFSAELPLDMKEILK